MSGQDMTRSKAFNRYVWIVLAINILVVLWGAYVRATGSGAGCGAHWPLCNGEVIPRTQQVETMVEFTHRLSSGVALLAVFIMVYWGWRIYPKGHKVRVGLVLSAVFIITEALVGAGLVLFELVAHNASVARVISVAVHLVNTFLLLASIAITAYWAPLDDIKLFRKSQLENIVAIFLLIMLLLIGTSGAITALGDTLFPVETLSEGLAQDFSATSHFLIRLRIWHPLLAVLGGLSAAIVAGILRSETDEYNIRRWSLWLIIAVVVQLIAGIVNVVLLAPVWMQLVHLFLADLVWLLTVLMLVSLYMWQNIVYERKHANE